MNYKFLFFFIFLVSCAELTYDKKINSDIKKNFFLNRGFSIIYNSELYKDKIINNKIEDRSLIIFQKNLKINTTVKVTNLINSKYILAKVGMKADYPKFYNSVISERIASIIEINPKQPYVEIKEIINGNIFATKKAITYDEEKQVASKAPIDNIKIKDLSNNVKDLSNNVKDKKKLTNNNFKYIIKVADFYFQKSAIEMVKRIKIETEINDVSIKKLSSTSFRVFIGPYNDLNSLKKSFNAIDILQFENIEIIKI